MIYYGVNLQILADQKEIKVKECFEENHNRMVENRTLALSYKVLFYFLFALVVGVAALLFMPISTLNFALSIFLKIIVVLVAIALLAIINVVYQATQLEFYNTCLPTMEYADNYRKEVNEKIIAKRNAKLASKVDTVEVKETETVVESKEEATEE